MTRAAPFSLSRTRSRRGAAALGLLGCALLSPASLWAQDDVTTRARGTVTTRARSEVTTRARSEVTTRARSEVTTRARSEATTRARSEATTRAQDDIAQGAQDDATTRALRLKFARGLTLENAGRWADALERFEAIARLRPTANVTFHVGLCNDRLGRLLKAERLYREARQVALHTATPAVLAEIDARLQDLEARMPRIVLNLAGATEGVILQLDGVPVEPSKAIRVDPGPHVAVALRHGIPVAASAFSSHERRTRFVTLTVHPPPPRVAQP